MCAYFSTKDDFQNSTTAIGSINSRNSRKRKKNTRKVKNEKKNEKERKRNDFVFLRVPLVSILRNILVYQFICAHFYLNRHYKDLRFGFFLYKSCTLFVRFFFYISNLTVGSIIISNVQAFYLKNFSFYLYSPFILQCIPNVYSFTQQTHKYIKKKMKRKNQTCTTLHNTYTHTLTHSLSREKTD